MAGLYSRLPLKKERRTFAVEERDYCVYLHISPSGKVYVGITKQSANGRWKNGLGYKSSPHFWNAIQKYGWDSFRHEILSDGLSEYEACEDEKRLISKYMATDRRFGYNEKTGGQKGSQLNKEARRKISDSLKRFYAEHPEKKEILAERATGYRHSDEAKAKISAAKKGRTFTQTPEWKQHIGEANKERIAKDPEYYEQISNRCRENGAKAAIPIVQMDMDGVEIASFESAHEAERETGVSNGNIGRCCKGNTKSAGGYKWRYAIEYNSGRETA